MNEDISTWENVVKNERIKCYRRPVIGSSSFLIKATAIIDNIDCEAVFQSIYDVNQRMSWDNVFKDFKIVIPQAENQNEIIYMAFQSPVFFIDNRDFVQQRKVWRDLTKKDSRIIHFKSIECPECPLRKKHIRAHTYISGYYIEKISDNPIRTKLIIISQNDIKGYIPPLIVNKAASKAPKQWVENLIKGCEKIRGSVKK